MWRAAKTHPWIVALVLAVLLFVATDGARRTFDQQHWTRHTWLVAILLIDVVCSAGSFGYLASPRRKQGDIDSRRPEMRLLCALAISPTLVGIGLTALHAPTWILWIALGTSYALLIWFAGHAGKMGFSPGEST